MGLPTRIARSLLLAAAPLRAGFNEICIAGMHAKRAAGMEPFSIFPVPLPVPFLSACLRMWVYASTIATVCEVRRGCLCTRTACMMHAGLSYSAR